MSDKRYDYSDIIDLDRPIHINDRFVIKHPPMSIENRAKIFAPFAALKRYNEAIDEASVVNTPDKELTDEDLEILDMRFTYLCHVFEEGQKPVVDVVHVHFNRDTNVVEYIRTKGLLAKVDMSAGYMMIVNVKIAFSDIYSIESEVFDSL